jgi:ribonuclease HII
MEKYAEAYPAYGFERNKGYGTAEHIKAIKEQGLCPIHRRTFTKKLLAGGGKSLPKNI